MSFDQVNIDDVRFPTGILCWFAPVGLFCILFMHYILLPVLLTFQFPRFLQAHAGKLPNPLIPVCVCVCVVEVRQFVVPLKYQKAIHIIE